MCVLMQVHCLSCSPLCTTKNFSSEYLKLCNFVTLILEVLYSPVCKFVQNKVVDSSVYLLPHASIYWVCM